MGLRAVTGLLATAGLLAAVTVAAETPITCDRMILALEPAAVFGPDAPCSPHKKAFCVRLETLNLGDFDQLADRVKAERGTAVSAMRPVKLEAAFSACGLDFQTLRSQQCLKAYRQESLGIVGKHCPDEAWALARAQCERSSDTVSGRYAEFCHGFTQAMP